MNKLTVIRATITAAMGITGLALTGIGTAHADAIQVEGNYATLADCQADGPQTRASQNGGSYARWSCHKGEDGLYYLYLSN